MRERDNLYLTMSHQKPTHTAKRGKSVGDIDAEMIARATECVSRLAEQYKDWVADDLTRLQNLLAETTRSVDGHESSMSPMERIYAVSHDMRGQGSTFGYPLITHIARSLCLYIRGFAGDPADATPIMQAHIDAIRAVIAGNVTDERGAQAQAISEKLRAATGRGLD